MATVSGARQARDHVQIIRPTTGWAGLRLGEVWQYRELLLTFTWRNVLVRYKQTALGIFWAILQPFFLMIVFTLLLHKAAKVPSAGIPYPIFTYAGLLPWMFFASSLLQSSLSLVAQQALIKKIYFPRLIIPLSSVLTALVDFAVASTVLGAMMIYFGVYPVPLRLLALPPLILLACVTALGCGLWLSSLNVRYRDVQYVVPFLTQIWLFSTTQIYSSQTFHEPWKTVLGLNPMQGVVGGFHWALLHRGPSPGWTILVSTGISLALLVTGALYFRRTERSFADVV
jgi:lipopolysaccharide transport system permease protein